MKRGFGSKINRREWTKPEAKVKGLPKKKFTGGVLFERLQQAKPVKPGIRCYTLANRREPYGRMGPSAQSKVYGSGEGDANVTIRSEIIKV